MSAPLSPHALPLHLIERTQFAAWKAEQPDAIQRWTESQAFNAAAGSVLLLPGERGVAGAVIGIGDPLDPHSYGHAPTALPSGTWTPAAPLPVEVQAALQLGWGLGSYRFDCYKARLREPAQLQLEAPDAETADVLAAVLRVRDWVNTPTEHLGPEQLEAAARAMAQAHGADVEVITGDALIEQNFPTIHAVGRASHRAPRLIVLRWGESIHAPLAVVGKGVCFDTGGLDIKPADGMRNMKKDMGGAAHALALAGLVMARQLPVRLTLLIPAVENAIGPDAFRPGDIIRTRSGVTVEVDNTDAEGRLILCDALTYAGEQQPELLLDFATLTGAARVALGPDLPALFSNDDTLALHWQQAGETQRDPVWRLPLWRPYLRYLTSPIADLANAGSRMAGAVTAALYLERFVPAGIAWAHLDTYAWNDSERAGRPAGGEALGLRSAWALLKARYGR
ncbi:MAG: leucyl aminopeptidase family protein [Pseudoxanthomonas sp.]